MAMTEIKPIATTRPETGNEVLPPVQPPTSGFLLQLFFIPLVIVLIIVVVWMLFSWLAHMGTSPRELVKEIRGRNNASWQRAVTLAEILDAAPTGDSNGVRRDRPMASELSQILIDVYRSGAKDESSLKLEEFLCSALGKFEVVEGVDTLAEVAAAEKASGQIDELLPVRAAAINGLAELISRLIEDQQLAQENIEALRSNKSLHERLAAITRENLESSSPSALQVDEIRARAAYALGLIGRPEGLDRLAVMIQDRSSNARNNAAFGLARHGDARALPGILEMLDPKNEAALLHENIGADNASLTEAESALNKDWKRSQVLQNGLNTAKLLIGRNQGADLSALRKPIADLTHVELRFYRKDLSSAFKNQTNRDIRSNSEAVKKLLDARDSKSK
jgi:hypothetical protein